MASVVERIAAFNADRDPHLLVRKYDRLQLSPFDFFRGTNHLFQEDWPSQHPLDEAPLAWGCGDLHLENFGTYKGDNRLTYFDLNDFDDALLAPASHDIVRFLCSLLVAGRALTLGQRHTLALATAFLDAYVATLAGGKAMWVERSTARGMVADLLARADGRSRIELLDERTRRRRVRRGWRRRVRLDGRRHVAADPAEVEAVTEAVEAFGSAHEEPRFFHVVDVARRIAGCASLGLARYVVLVRGRKHPHGNFLLDVKRAGAPAAQAWSRWPQPRWSHEADRICTVQAMTQAVSPAILAPIVIRGRSYVLRELQPTEDRLDVAAWRGKLSRLEKVVQTMGRLAAWAQLRASGRRGAAPADALVAFAHAEGWRRQALGYARAYTEHVVRDWTEFREAAADGALALPS